MAAVVKPPVAVVIPPPLLFVLTFFAGLLLQRIVPLPSYVGAPPLLLRIAGIAMVGFAVLLVLGCVLLFLRARTTIIPHGQASSLVRNGPYRFSRNPMYLAIASAYLGIAVLTGSLWPVLLLPLPLWILQRFVIPFEEATLRRVFGSDYDAYYRQVRRWV
jgi:protein-S-isoprenylcysteine O-methyltransferase Ste14